MPRKIAYYFVKVKCGRFTKRLRFADYFSALDFVYSYTHTNPLVDEVRINVVY